jgi:hypothetical protein
LQIAFDFSGGSKKQGSIFEIKFDLASRGANVQPFSIWPQEAELLFGPYTSLCVENAGDVQKKGRKRFIKLRASISTNRPSLDEQSDGAALDLNDCTAIPPWVSSMHQIRTAANSPATLCTPSLPLESTRRISFAWLHTVSLSYISLSRSGGRGKGRSKGRGKRRSKGGRRRHDAKPNISDSRRWRHDAKPNSSDSRRRHDAKPNISDSRRGKRRSEGGRRRHDRQEGRRRNGRGRSRRGRSRSRRGGRR